MRTIKFRGKRLDNQEWTYGYFYQENDNTYIIEDRQKESMLNRNIPHKVNPETVGQFTNLKDSKGNEVYEGDIVVCDNGIIVNEKYACVVVFKHGSFCLRSVDNTVTTSIIIHVDCGRLLCWKVFGNVFDNKAKEGKEYEIKISKEDN